MHPHHSSHPNHPNHRARPGERGLWWGAKQTTSWVDRWGCAIRNIFAPFSLQKVPTATGLPAVGSAQRRLRTGAGVVAHVHARARWIHLDCAQQVAKTPAATINKQGGVPVRPHCNARTWRVHLACAPGAAARVRVRACRLRTRAGARHFARYLTLNPRASFLGGDPALRSLRSQPPQVPLALVLALVCALTPALSSPPPSLSPSTSPAFPLPFSVPPSLPSRLRLYPHHSGQRLLARSVIGSRTKR